MQHLQYIISAGSWTSKDNLYVIMLYKDFVDKITSIIIYTEDFMLVFKGTELENYAFKNLQINPLWKHRDFVANVIAYINSSTERVLAIGGLRGTGKTVGIMQAGLGKDFCYILAQRDEQQTGVDYIKALKESENRIIAIDEYSWIRNRDELDRYLITAIQNGKRILITGTESITLDFLNYGAINHRVGVVHTTMFTYEEYCRLYDIPQTKASCKRFLVEGGVFRDYILNSYDATKNYIEDAIINNLASYLGDTVSKEKAAALTYAVLYKAICPSNLSSIPTLRNNKITVDNFLDKMGINTDVLFCESDLKRVADIFEKIGLIVRVKNIDAGSDVKEQYYITNPSLTCQLILAAYNINEIDQGILGHVFEACSVVRLATNKLSEHVIYFYNHTADPTIENDKNKELDIIITNDEMEFAYLFECKFTQNNSVDKKITLLSGDLEKTVFKHTEILGRYIIFTGEASVKKYNVGDIIFTPMNKMLDYYFEFSTNVNTIQKSQSVSRN